MAINTIKWLLFLRQQHLPKMYGMLHRGKAKLAKLPKAFALGTNVIQQHEENRRFLLKMKKQKILGQLLKKALLEDCAAMCDRFWVGMQIWDQSIKTHMQHK